MSNYLVISDLEHILINKNMIGNFYGTFELIITGHQLYELYEKSLVHIFDEIQLPINIDNLKIEYNFDSYPFKLYKKNINNHEVCSFDFYVSVNDFTFSILINLYCKCTIDKNITSDTVTIYDSLHKIMLIEPLLICMSPCMIDEEKFILYLDNLNPNCTLPIYFRNDFSANFKLYKLIHNFSECECDEFIHILFKTLDISNSYTYTYILNKNFQKNARNVIDA